ncbi:MAG: hypothetical protein FJY66_05200 [Calditrichaeota bacterium]|nr:hypothetical protein [Calditrichota bacterium]
MTQIFHTIILTARPAAGKSEVIDFLKKLPAEERRSRYHIGQIAEVDDFPYIWEKFEEDDIFSKHGRPRVYTDEKYWFKDPWLWDFFLLKMNIAYEKLLRNPKIAETTILVEFARGGENALSHTFSVLSPDILRQAGILYIDVSYEESVRKNRRRFRPAEADSILFHSLPDDKMEFYYKVNDWHKLASDQQGILTLQNIRVPYAVLPNEPEVTDTPEHLAKPLQDALERLWQGYLTTR